MCPRSGPDNLAADTPDSIEIPDCVSCGACCAWSETWPVLIGARDGEGIPDDLIDFEHRRMQSWGNRCAALEGTLGIHAICSVYRQRPLVCREFQAGSEDCRMVRRAMHINSDTSPRT